MSIRCAIYTRKSTDEGLEKEFNSLDAQREACESYVQSQRGQGWRLIKKRYDDGGLSGGTMERPALIDLMADIDAGRVDLVVVYKVDRLTRSLADFAKIIETFDARGISFVSVTQQFNTANSMGRLTLNVLLSFAQFEREVTAERIRDKIAASKKKGMWMGGPVPLGYDLKDRKLHINQHEAETVRKIFDLYGELGSVRMVKEELDKKGVFTKRRIQKNGKCLGGKPFSRGNLYQLLSNPLYIGQVAHRGATYPGEHKPIIDAALWNKVQSALKGNGPKRNQDKNNESPFLLAGLVFDEAGGPLYLAQTRNHEKRYGYYVSKSLVGGGNGKAEGWRLPAKMLEDVIITAITEMLASEAEWLKHFDPDCIEIAQLKSARDRASSLASNLCDCSQGEKKSTIRGLLECVQVLADNIKITINKRGLGDLLGFKDKNIEGTIITDIPTRLQRRGVETKIVIEGQAASHINPSLCRMIAQAHRWFEQLATGEVATVRDIADQENIRASEITRILRLAFLSPKIVEDILDGEQLAQLTTHRLRRFSNLPLDWDQQAIEIAELG
jgi:site-specific DNA recombinase